MASPALAAPKQSVAILGLEVVDASGNVDPEAVKVAKELTDGLRARAKVGSGPYVLAPGSDKELIDEKLIKNCDTEALACMAQIGKELGANYLIYGRLEKKGDGYQVTINLLNIDKKKFEKAKTPLTIPFSQKDSASLAAAAKRAYNDLTGVSEAGSLVVTANVQSGEVFLDDVSRGTLSGGSLTIDKLAEGRYRLAVESQSYKRYEIVITIRSGEAMTQSVSLVPVSVVEVTGTTSTTKRNYWKPVAVGFAVLAAGSAGLWAYSYSQYDDYTGKVYDEIAPMNQALANSVVNDSGSNNCENSEAKGLSGSLRDLCSARDRTKWGIIGTSVFGALAVGAAVMAFRSSEETPPPPSSTLGQRRTKKRSPISVTPILSPDGGGATVQLDW